MEARSDGSSLEDAVEVSCGWGRLERLAVMAGQLTDTVKADPLDHVAKGRHRFRLYAPRMLKALDISGGSVADALIEAAAVIRDGREIPVGAASFLRPRSSWSSRLQRERADREGLWTVAVLFHLRDAFRSGDIWLNHSRRYADMKQALVPIEAARAMPQFVVPLGRVPFRTAFESLARPSSMRCRRSAAHASGSQGSTCSRRSSSTGIPRSSATQSANANSRASIRRWTCLRMFRRLAGLTFSSPENTGGAELCHKKLRVSFRTEPESTR